MTGRTVLVTGADGFVGSALIDVLQTAGLTVKAIVRHSAPPVPYDQTAIGDIGEFAAWAALLSGVEAVVHLAGISHDPAGRVTEDDYRRINVTATATLAAACAAAGVSDFIFMSTLKVLGEQSRDVPLSQSSPVRPSDPYSRSKAMAEEALARVFSTGGTRLSVVRPPLVYGPGVKANFLRMLDAVHLGIPLPFGRVENKRSMVSIWNLCDLLRTLVLHPDPTAGTWHVSDGEDLSTPELLRRMGLALGRPARLVPVPLGILSAAATLTGRKREFERLVTSLCVDISDTCDRLGWRPPLSMVESISRTASWYAAARRATP